MQWWKHSQHCIVYNFMLTVSCRDLLQTRCAHPYQVMFLYNYTDSSYLNNSYRNDTTGYYNRWVSVAGKKMMLAKLFSYLKRYDIVAILILGLSTMCLRNSAQYMLQTDALVIFRDKSKLVWKWNGTKIEQDNWRMHLVEMLVKVVPLKLDGLQRTNPYFSHSGTSWKSCIFQPL